MAASSKDSNQSIIIAESSTSNSKSTTPANLLSVLRCPKFSELACKRVIDRNPPKRKKYSRTEGVSDLKSVDPRQHVRVFPSESLTVSNGKLFCSACREELSLKKCIVTLHLQSTKHKSGKERLERKKKQDMDIAEALQASDSDCYEK